ncbi:hypothetical protein VTN00DRAFT_6572 [Thermoascus crustaceus]|uniref:uncharacterized protein n=1 Tax=Thermoascus crustaceus TaxID=5088 RepID=UPI003744AD31
MAQFIPNITTESLQDKVVVVTGGANGIGASLVELCCQHGAYVCFGDVDTASGEQLARKLSAKTPESKPRAYFLTVDASNYQSNVELFRTALKTYSKIDHAVAAAGIVEIGNWFDPALTVETVEEAPPIKVLEVNLIGCLYFARIASVYLRQNREPGADRSLTLISSIAGFKESPGLFVYQSSKHGVLGLMRALRRYIALPTTHDIRVNAICPWMTDTAIVRGIEKAWKAANLPVNTPLHVARVVGGVVCQKGLNGKSMYVEGGRAWEIEDNIDRLEPQWLGEEASRTLQKGQEVLGSGMDWAQ